MSDVETISAGDAGNLEIEVGLARTAEREAIEKQLMDLGAKRDGLNAEMHELNSRLDRMDAEERIDMLTEVQKQQFAQVLGAQGIGSVETVGAAGAK